MSRSILIELLEAFNPSNPHQILTKQRCLDFARQEPRCMDREFQSGHFTASALVLSHDEESVLLVYHRKLSRWLQPGGHFDSVSEAPQAAARREVFEETGLERLDCLGDGIFWLDIHEIPPFKQFPAHLHYDVRFLLKSRNAESDEALRTEVGSPLEEGLAWCPVDAVAGQSGDASVSAMVASLPRRTQRYELDIVSRINALPNITHTILAPIPTERGELPLFRLKLESAQHKPWILLSAGIHGDERDGTRALLDLIDARGLPTDFNYWIYPCLNPWGYERGNRAGSSCADLNRECFPETLAPEMKAVLKDLEAAPTFLASLELHEDLPFIPDEHSSSQFADGFYLYESSALRSARIAHRINERLQNAGTRILSHTSLYGDHCEYGVIAYGEGSENQSYLGRNTFDSYLRRHKTSFGLIFEVPGGYTRRQKVPLHQRVLVTALEALIEREQMTFVSDGL